MLLERGRGCTPLGEMAARLFLRPGLVEAAAARLAGAGGLRLEGDAACVDDPLALALAAVKLGVSETAVARHLDWRMFEEYAARALAEAGFEALQGLRVHGPGGLELDVLGLDAAAGLAVAVDCKHWSPRVSTPSRLRAAAARHRERLGRLIRHWRRLGLPPGRWRIVPALLVLREHAPRLAEGVPVVPASRLRGFLEELPALAEDPAVYVARLEA
ncbi:hypothetical protein CF15_07110 [Pyrodictium occultum]|uniref:Restriction endonuclease type IV Mrr domain-containing protein n=1 Tax=Pyrodictium occultum TaxID=2309 RepID=A0A0V8RWT4_PYROC|nr:hypothetical protein CF15_07110 [Pyrodictium occultum]